MKRLMEDCIDQDLLKKMFIALGIACIPLWIVTAWCELNTVVICPICCCHVIEPWSGCPWIRLLSIAVSVVTTTLFAEYALIRGVTDEAVHSRAKAQVCCMRKTAHHKAIR